MSRKRLFGNLGALAAGRLVSIPLGAATLAFMTRDLGAARFGQVTLAIAFVTIVFTFADAGISMIVPRDLARIEDVSIRSRAAAAIVALGTLLYALSSSVALGVALLLFGDGRHVLVLEAIAVLLGIGLVSPFTTVGVALAAAANRQYRVAAAQVASGACVSVAMIAAILIHAPAYALVLAYGLGSIVSGALLMALPRDARTGLRVDRSVWRVTLGESLPMLAVTSINNLYAKVDVIILSALTTSVAVGRYGLAYKVVDVTMALPALFILVAQPQMVRAYRDAPDFDRVMSVWMSAMCAIAVPVGVILIRFASGASLLLGGHGFARAGGALQVLMLAVIITFPTAVLSAGLVTMGRQRQLLYTTSVALVTNVIANVILIPLLGIVGAASALVVSEIAVLSSMAWIYQHFAPLPRLNEVSGIVTAAVGMLVVAIVGPLLVPMRPVPELFLWGGASGAGYAILVLLLRIPDTFAAALVTQSEPGGTV